jgi:hypothetical protein
MSRFLESPALRIRKSFSGQAIAEYLVILVAVVAGIASTGLFGDGGGVLAQLVDALRAFHYRFATVLSWPL